MIIAMQEHSSDAAVHAVMDSTLPLWFKPEKFLEPEFSAEAYVADLKRYVSGPLALQPASRSSLLCAGAPAAVLSS